MRHNLKRTKRTLAWIRRFINNSRVKEKVKRKKGHLNLKRTGEWYICHGRIIGDYPIFIPKSTFLTEKLVEKAHYQTFHGGSNVNNG